MFRIAAYHWSPAAQRRFIEVLAETGSVQQASNAVSMSRVAAYRFRKRAVARAFAIGWDAAVLMAEEEHFGKLMEYALAPVEYIGVRNPQTGRLHFRCTDPTLGRGKGTAMLLRLDQASKAMTAEERNRAQAVMCDFEAFLGIIERGGDEAELTQFFGDTASQEEDSLCVTFPRILPFSAEA